MAGNAVLTEFPKATHYIINIYNVVYIFINKLQSTNNKINQPSIITKQTKHQNNKKVSRHHHKNAENT